MLNLTFKNVGQGDTIIIEWNDKGQTKIGVIDTCVFQKRNPVLEFLQANTIKAIEFYILSHPHFDHFSGISDVLDYCYQKRIFVNRFYHTLSGTIVKIYSFDYSIVRQLSAKRLIETLDKYSNGRHKIILKKNRIDCERENIILNEEVEITILSPNDNDYHELEKMIGMSIAGKTSTNPDANKVSTILQIRKNNEYILLTSDALKSRIGRIEKFLTGYQMIIGQVPHHGSENNHRKAFWENTERKDGCIAVFSCGDDHADNLPDNVTVQNIANLSYKIHSTNQVNGICSVFGEPDTSETDHGIISDVFDFFQDSNVLQPNNVINNDLNGDQLFNVWK